MKSKIPEQEEKKKVKKKRIPQIITPDELEKIMLELMNLGSSRKNSDYGTFCGIRNCVMVYLMYYMGLRPKECYNAKLEYLDFEKNKFYIPAMSNKQRQQDVISIPQFLVNIVEKYLETRRKIFPNSQWLFPTRKKYNNPNDAIDRGTFIRAFRKACERANLLKTSYIDQLGRERKNITLYSLRHSYGTLVYSKTKDIRKTAQVMRHRDWMCRSTLTYVHTTQNLNDEEILKEVFPKEAFEKEIVENAAKQYC